MRIAISTGTASVVSSAIFGERRCSKSRLELVQTAPVRRAGAFLW